MSDCLFCKIRDGKIPAKQAYKDERVFGFEDINPQAPTHVLLVPNQHLATVNELTIDHRELVGHLFWAAGKVAQERGISDTGYRLVMNTNRDAGQTVFHIHLHLLGGRAMQWPPG